MRCVLSGIAKGALEVCRTECFQNTTGEAASTSGQRSVSPTTVRQQRGQNRVEEGVKEHNGGGVIRWDTEGMEHGAGDMVYANPFPIS